MRELSMHILDLAQNSIVAGATRIVIEVTANTQTASTVVSGFEQGGNPETQPDTLTISIADDGKGMDEEFLARVKDPFTTTRTTRSVGLGIPMFTEAAQACEGDVTVESEPDNGTKITATFKLSHIDRAPLGDMASTMVALIAPDPDIAFRYVQRIDGSEFVLDTDELKEQLGDVPLNEPAVLQWIQEYVRERTSGECSIE